MKGEKTMRDRNTMPSRRRRSEPMSYEGIEETFNKYLDSFVGYVDNFFNRDGQTAFDSSIKADIRECEKEYILEAEMPGYKKEDISVELIDDQLNISAKREESVEEAGKNYIRRERRLGTVGRSFTVHGIKQEGVKAEYKDGMLHIVLPKSEDNIKRGKNIEVK